MAVHNGARFLPAALESVASQTMRDFELLVIDDGSTDATADMLAAHAANHPGTRVYPNERNIGLTASLNRGLGLARSKYIARLDADDLAMPERLARQTEFLDANPDHVFVGSREKVVDASGRSVRRGRGALTSAETAYLANFTPPIVHSSAMIRRSALLDHDLRYDEQFVTAQDFDFWQRLLRIGKGARLGDTLVALRQHDTSVSRVRRTAQEQNAIAIAQRSLAENGALSDEGAQAVARFVTVGELDRRYSAGKVMDLVFDFEAGWISQQRDAPTEISRIPSLTAGILLKGMSRATLGYTDRLKMAGELMRGRFFSSSKELVSIGLRRLI
ncbi:glycosyltransferase family A protein [Qipengyuania sp. JC766]|uniref:glycosyltransferase family 2 protein n=1 Tax=Qipengyuania sp. JC766 TaxID=3232139 RepID=UPI00345B3E2D